MRRGKAVYAQMKKKTARFRHTPILTDHTRFVGRLSFIVLSESGQSTAHPHTHKSRKFRLCATLQGKVVLNQHTEA